MLKFARFRHVFVVLAVSLVLAVPVALAASTPKAGHWVGKATSGEVGKGKYGQPTFTVSKDRKTLKKFTIPEVGAFCFAGYQVVTVYVGHAAIKHGTVNTTYLVDKTTKAKVQLKGKFNSATKFTGQVSSRTYCDYTIKFVAHHK